jgi:hypothetical protein
MRIQHLALGSVARRATPVAAVDFGLGPILFRSRHCSVATRVIPEIDLVLGKGHVVATGGLVVNFVIAVRLRVFVEDELGHTLRGGVGVCANSPLELLPR